MNDWFTRNLQRGDVPTYIDVLGDLAGTVYSIGYIKGTFDDGEVYYMAWHPELDGCMTQVSDLADLPAMLADAREGWIAVSREHGLAVPAPLSHLTRTT